MYKINNKTYSCDSIANQKIKQKFVTNNVFCCVTSMVEYILSADSMSFPRFDPPFRWEDIENLCFDDDEPQEIYEWYLVDNWFADKLAEHGAPVIRNGDICGSLWGRTAAGQAIMLDGVISEICEEMGILEGQEYSWERSVN